MEEQNGEDKFKPVFKYYKSKVPPPSLENVFDSRNSTCTGQFEAKSTKCSGTLTNHTHLCDSNLWKVYEFANGLHLISNPFKEIGLSYWTLRCLKDFSDVRNNLKMTGYKYQFHCLLQ